MVTEQELIELRSTCSRFVHGHGPVRVADLLSTVPADTVVDRYGDGGVVAELEAEVARILGKAAAVFFPSGTMAQQVVLRVHADRRGRRTVVFHPTCHLDRQESGAYARLQQLVGRSAGEAHRLLTVDDLSNIAEPVGALVLELPQREIGGQQPEWPELVAQVKWARDCGAAVHLDGARLWESAAGYGRPPGEIADLFDTAYVSFYKGLGALPGCCVAGDADLIAEAREWRRRMGGTLFGLWPNAASALTCLAHRLPLMPAYLEQARAIAAALSDLAGVRVIPDPPQTSMMHLALSVTQQRFDATVRELAETQGLWTWQRAMATDDPAVQRVELSVGDATCVMKASEIRDVIAAFVTEQCTDAVER